MIMKTELNDQGVNMDRIYYELVYQDKVYFTVYSDDQIYKKFCDMVHGYGIKPDDIHVLTYVNGIKTLDCVINE